MMNSNPTTKARLQDNLLGNGLPTPPCSVRQTQKLSMVISSTTEQVYASIDITDIVTYRTERVNAYIIYVRIIGRSIIEVVGIIQRGSGACAMCMHYNML